MFLPAAFCLIRFCLLDILKSSAGGQKTLEEYLALPYRWKSPEMQQRQDVRG